MSLEKRRKTIADLSPELLTEIFVSCLPDDSLPKLRIEEAPLLFGRICRTWRNIANSTAQLWNKIELTLEDEEEFNGPPFHLWMKKSGALPLTIQIYDRRDESNGSDDGSTENESSLSLFEHVFLYASRLKRLSIHGNEGTNHVPHLEFLFSKLTFPPGAPLLEDLEIIYPDATEASALPLNLKSCPSLVNLALQTGNFPCVDGEWSLSKLKSFKLPTYTTSDKLLPILLHTPSVEVVEVVFSASLHSFVDNANTEIGTIVSLPHLTHLTVKYISEAVESWGIDEEEWDDWGNINYGLIYSQLKLPSLDNMTFDFGRCNDDAPDWCINLFTELVTRSNSSLSSLSIRYMVLDSSYDFITLLRRLSSLRHFEFENFNGTNSAKILDALAEANKSNVLCPLLEQLDIVIGSYKYHRDGLKVFSKSFLQFLHSWFGDVKSEDGLKNEGTSRKVLRVRISVCDDKVEPKLDVEVVKGIDVYRQKGLDFQFTGIIKPMIDF